MIRDIGVTRGDESQVGHYVGILVSFRLPDHIGRKPVIPTALLAISVSIFSFGLSKTSVCRAVCGAFNGSNSVIKSMVMAITDATNMPKAYSYMPIPWRPELLKTYPYILSCSISMIFVLAAWLVVYFCLKESVSTRTPPWELIKGGFLGQSYVKPRQPSSNVVVNPAEAHPGGVQSKPLRLRALQPRNCATTGLFHTAFNSVLPDFHATPIELGGLYLDTPRIGAILVASGVSHGIFQLVFYARLHDHLGARAIQITGISSGIHIVIIFPVINALARAHGIGLAVWQSLFIRAAAPNRASLGATNGIAQMFAAGAKIIGPASAASVFSYSMEEGHDAWLVYYILMAIAFLAAHPMPSHWWRRMEMEEA
ncbi:hypothetical protein DFJ58DRAFT_718123 [Suillus subalutaceus]|uniref:uncharacterized protein n=1 Tax=Suillus subalutaceus TaxID=48586 RepID=UPI001B862006|nr:uncharacterized protein DFJ58DRAFT_718123 [Suillus subalutaceus]KAG1841672.1 hypothetical protein DFJ58DRAFT_718123 [Suillus subalutaceus]